MCSVLSSAGDGTAATADRLRPHRRTTHRGPTLHCTRERLDSTGAGSLTWCGNIKKVILVSYYKCFSTPVSIWFIRLKLFSFIFEILLDVVLCCCGTLSYIFYLLFAWRDKVARCSDTSAPIRGNHSAGPLYIRLSILRLLNCIW